jgi:hypothetical protein
MPPAQAEMASLTPAESRSLMVPQTGQAARLCRDQNQHGELADDR